MDDKTRESLSELAGIADRLNDVTLIALDKLARRVFSADEYSAWIDECVQEIKAAKIYDEKIRVREYKKESLTANPSNEEYIKRCNICGSEWNHKLVECTGKHCIKNKSDL